MSNLVPAYETEGPLTLCPCCGARDGIRDRRYVCFGCDQSYFCAHSRRFSNPVVDDVWRLEWARIGIELRAAGKLPPLTCATRDLPTSEPAEKTRWGVWAEHDNDWASGPHASRSLADVDARAMNESMREYGAIYTVKPYPGPSGKQTSESAALSTPSKVDPYAAHNAAHERARAPGGPDPTCVCGHPMSMHRPMKSAVLSHGALGCMAQDCACGPGCIHEGFVDASATSAPAGQTEDDDGPWYAGAIGKGDDDQRVYRDDAVTGPHFYAASPKQAEVAAIILNGLERRVRKAREEERANSRETIEALTRDVQNALDMVGEEREKRDEAVRKARVDGVRVAYELACGADGQGHATELIGDELRRLEREQGPERRTAAELGLENPPIDAFDSSTHAAECRCENVCYAEKELMHTRVGPKQLHVWIGQRHDGWITTLKPHPDVHERKVAEAKSDELYLRVVAERDAAVAKYEQLVEAIVQATLEARTGEMASQRVDLDEELADLIAQWERENAEAGEAKMASGRMTLIIDSVVLRGDGTELQSLRGLLVGPRGSEREVMIHIDPVGWQLTGFRRSPPNQTHPPFIRKTCDVCGASPRTHACDEEACEPKTGTEEG